MKSSPVLKEASRLYKLGFSILWIHPGQKRPIESGWTTGPRTSWEHLKETYIEGLNVGVRTGTPSKIGKNYLCVIDVDIKDESFKKTAIAKVKEITNGAVLPMVLSGSGNGSRHYYCVTKEPFKMKTILKGESGEVCIYSDGRQMVLPPSKTKQPYQWVRHISDVSSLPLVQFKELAAAPGAGDSSVAVNKLQEPVQDIKFQKVDLDWLPVSDKVRLAIKEGIGVADRSGYLLTAVSALNSAGLDRDEILSVLTDSGNWLSACAYEHAKTNSRKRAAQWLLRYTVKKVLTERSATSAFAEVPLPMPGKEISDKEAKAQAEEFESDNPVDWRARLDRGGRNGVGPVLPSIKNVILILENEITPELVKRNDFAYRDTFSLKAPWGSKKDALVADDDMPNIIYWLSQHYKFEPPRRVVEDALIVMASQNCFDPVRDWLDLLPAWDQKPRLGKWLTRHFQATGDPEYLNQVFSKWMSAMVRRIYEPGSKFDWMPIFEGYQGTGKSSFGRLLVGDKYFLDWLPNLADKDSALGLQGHWAVEMGELSQFKRNELETIKAFITRTVDKFRPPHGRKLIDSPRRCVFFGTTNKKTYLLDDTGNRRFKPVMVGKLNFEKLEIDRDQMFAEAKHLYKTKYNTNLSYELTGDAKIYEAKIHAEKMVEDESDVMFLMMQDFLKKVDSGNAQFDREKFRIMELFGVMGPMSKLSPSNRNLQFAAKMLKKFGGEKRHIKGMVFWKIDKGDRFDEDPITLDFY